MAENIDFINIGNKINIKSVKFNSDLLNNTCIKNMEEWNNIPKFSILTGANGSGKSQILSYIKKCASKTNGKIIFYNFENELENYIRQEENHSTREFLSNQFINQIRDKIRLYLNDRNHENLTFLQENFLNDEQEKDINSELDKLLNNPDENLKEKAIERIINYITKVYDSKCNLIKIFQIFENVDNSKNELIKKFGNVDFIRDLNKLEEFYRRTYPDQTDFLEKLKDPNKDLIKEYADSLFKYPLIEINDDLKIFDFKIEKIESNYCLKKLSDSSIRIKQPSTGEMFILSMIASKYELTND